MLWNYFCSLTVQVTPMLQINFSSEEEAKNRFSNGRHFGFPIFFFFFFFLLLIYKSPLPSLESIGLSAQEKKRKIDFQDGGCGGHFGFPIRKILAIFDLQVTRCFLPSIESIGPGV